MIRPSVYGVALLVSAGVLAGCRPECRVVQHFSPGSGSSSSWGDSGEENGRTGFRVIAAQAAGGSQKTLKFPADGNDCEVHMYQKAGLDSVGPKPR